MALKRDLLDKLVIWKTSTNRKPLVIEGARQVGKTWLMKEFGRTCFEQYTYINFEELNLHDVFAEKNPFWLAFSWKFTISPWYFSAYIFLISFILSYLTYHTKVYFKHPT